MLCGLLRLRFEFPRLCVPEGKFEFLDKLGPNMRGELTFWSVEVLLVGQFV